MYIWYNIQGIIFSKFYINVKKIYKDLFFSMNKLIFKNKKFLPKSSNLMSFAAWIPSSFKFFSICLLRALEALSSADIAHPMMKFGVHEVKVDVAPPQMGICKKGLVFSWNHFHEIFREIDFTKKHTISRDNTVLVTILTKLILEFRILLFAVSSFFVFWFPYIQFSIMGAYLIGAWPRQASLTHLAWW